MMVKVDLCYIHPIPLHDPLSLSQFLIPFHFPNSINITPLKLYL